MVLNNTVVVAYNGTDLPEQLLKIGRDQLLRIELYVSLTAILLSVLVVFGSTRRHWDSLLVKGPVWVSYVFSSTLVFYSLGLMQSFSYHNLSFNFWAAFLLIALARVDSMTAFSLDDNENRRRFLLEAMLQMFLVDYMIPQYNYDPRYRVALYLLVVLGFTKSAFTAEAMMSASMSSGLARDNKLIADFMGYEHELSEEDHVNPLTMTGYNYLVYGEDEGNVQVIRPHYQQRLEITDKVITLQKIWQCQGRLFTRSGSGDRYRDICLSYAFYRLICCRFAGYSLPKCNRDKSWNLVRYGLISQEKSGDHHKVFKVIEAELAFVYDLFYTKYPSVSTQGYLLVRLLELVIVSLGCWAAASTLTRTKETSGYMSLVTKSRHSIDIVVTAIVIITIFLVEFVQLFYIITSDWMKVKVICRYVKKTSWQSNRWLQKMIETMCSVQWKPWQRKLNQYSLLMSCRYTPSLIIYNWYVTKAIDKPRKGQKQGKAIGLPEPVKMAVVNSLILNGPTLSNGEASLRRNGFAEQLSWACNLETTTHVILVWHIATCVCEMELSSQSITEEATKLRNSEQFLVANALSKYCAYLVAFLPKLLPDHSYITEFIFDHVISEARIFLKGCETEASKYDMMMDLVQIENLVQLEDLNCMSIVIMGAKLGRFLVQDIGIDLSWKVLADFWAELVLFLAPSEELKCHAEQLANGGEFLTHLWALLFHAGIVNRDSSSS